MVTICNYLYSLALQDLRALTVEVTAVGAAAAAVKATAAARTVKRIAETANLINRSVS